MIKIFFFCREHFDNHSTVRRGDHRPIKLSRIYRDKRCSFNLEKLNKIKIDIINRSNFLVQTILSITECYLSKISYNSNQIKEILKKNNWSHETDKMIEEYGNIELKEIQINKFTEIAKNYLCVLANGIEILPSTFNITQTIKGAKRNAKEKEKEKEKGTRNQSVFREAKNKKPDNMIGILRKSKELLNLIELLEVNFNDIIIEIERHIQKVIGARINDKVVIKNAFATVVNSIEMIEESHSNLISSVNGDISTEKMIIINNNASDLIPSLNEIAQSSKSLLKMFKMLEDNGDISNYRFDALKITIDKKYYFFYFRDAAKLRIWIAKESKWENNGNPYYRSEINTWKPWIAKYPECAHEWCRV